MARLGVPISRSELKPGDHIYTWRKLNLYTHHGIYIGEGKTIHFTAGEYQTTKNRNSIFPFSSISSSASGSSRTPCPQCGDQSNHPSGVISSCLDCFLNGGNLYLYEYDVTQDLFVKKRGGTCTLAPSDSPEDVLHRALYLLAYGGFKKYNLLNNNCEDFTIYCKTGLIAAYNIYGASGQVTSFIGGLPLPFLGVTGVALHRTFRITSDIGSRRNLFKIPVEEFCL